MTPRDDERRKFEACKREFWKERGASDKTIEHKMALDTHATGGFTYAYDPTEFEWRGWMARAEQAETPSVDHNAIFGLPEIFVATGQHSRTAFFNLESAQRYIAERVHPERFKVVVYRKAETPRAAEWIPVTERMPPHDKPVRFFNGMQGDAVCRNSKWFLLYGAEEMLELPNVTHWMPMPNIPSAAAHRPAPTPEQFKNSCNRHSDCAAATEQFKAANGGRSPGVNFHCHDEECEDCFGC